MIALKFANYNEDPINLYVKMDGDIDEVLSEKFRKKHIKKWNKVIKLFELERKYVQLRKELFKELKEDDMQVFINELKESNPELFI